MAENDDYKFQKKTAVYLLLSSTSSDDSDIEELIKKRTSVPKIKNYVNDVVNLMNEQQFKGHFRLLPVRHYRYVYSALLPETAEMLIKKFEKSRFYPKNENRGGRQQITASSHILSFLWFAGNKCSLRTTADRFGMTISSLLRVSERVMNFLISIGSSVIKMPNSCEEKQQMAAEFQNVSGFPGVIGCIDVTSVRIRTPAHKVKSTYVNRHDIPSINLQGICDFKRRFIDIFTGIPGKIHDSRVLKLSDISKGLPELCGNHYHLLGDNGYPIRKWLLVPYRDYGNITERQRSFNRKLSSTRVLIENTFGILKGRFRQLLQLDMHTVPKMTKFIISCCILHNICIDNNDVLDEQEIVNDDIDNSAPTIDSELRLKCMGENKRNRLCEYLHYMD